MGTNYYALPVNEELLNSARQFGVPVPDGISHGRAATLDELRAVVRAIPGYSVEEGGQDDDFSLTVESEERITFPYDGPPCRNSVGSGLAEGPASWTYISGSVGATGTIKCIVFHGDMKLLLEVVGALTRTCGPQTFMSDYDGVPWLMLSPGATPVGPEPWNEDWADPRPLSANE